MEGDNHGVLRLPNYFLYNNDTHKREGSEETSREQDHDTKQSQPMSGKALAASVLA